MTAWTRRKVDQRSAENADQAEFAALKFSVAPVAEGIRDEEIADALDDFGESDGAQKERWAIRDSKLDDAAGATADEIARRSTLLGAAYPFGLDGNRITYKPSKTLVYEFCLAVSNSPSIVSKPYDALPPSFERLCRDLICSYWGPDSTAYRSGWPPEPDRDANFKSVADKLAPTTGEWCWNPRPGLPEDPRHQDLKDLGIDFVVWRGRIDKRKGVLMGLGQCACGNDWPNKFDELSLSGIGDWFRDLSVAAPVRLFCVPHHIANEAWFDEANRKAGLTFDRARLATLAEKVPQAVSTLEAQKLINLVAEAAEPELSQPPQKEAEEQRSQSRVRVRRASRSGTPQV